ncbi:PH domain-containing protein [Streptomyces sp. NPDC048664]|uniref:PH domain-containing protein n=1 Tax=Streptomyces sp. NPDC048664 TaxID=3154505 RepID=UPI0034240546
MTTSDHQPPSPGPAEPGYADRIHRSHLGIASGVLLLAIVLWLGIDAIVAGHGRTPWLALATLILVIPLVTAFTLRPAVYANEERLRVRNPFRVIVLPWGSVATLRSGYSNEVVTSSGSRYQLWAIPVSLRGRKRANRQAARRDNPDLGRGGGLGGLGGLTGSLRGGPMPQGTGPIRAEGDQNMDSLRELAEAHATSVHAQGEPTVRWAYEVIAPAVAGAVLLAILLAIG